METSKNKWKKLIVLALVFIICLFSLVRCRNLIYIAVENQVYGSLKDVALQNEVMIERELNTTSNFLANIASLPQYTEADLNSEETIKSLVNSLKITANAYGYKRMGIITPDGTAYCTDNRVSDLSHEDSYRYGIKGFPNISESITDTVGSAEAINVFSVPLFNRTDGTVKGVLFATHRTERLKQLLNVNSFDGKGYSYVTTGDGNVITDSKQSPIYGAENVFDALTEVSPLNHETIAQVRASMDQGLSGSFSVTNDGIRYVHYVPLKVDALHQSWYLYTIVPASALDQKYEIILYHMDRMLAIVFLSMAVLLFYYIWNYHKSAQHLFQIAYTDPLTKGDNYSSFLYKIKHKSGIDGYMVSLDLNEFKLINSICGARAGDRVLKSIWNIISSDLGENELAAHVRGDRYIMFLTSASREEIIERVKTINNQIIALPEQLNTIQIQPYFGIYKTSNLGDPEEGYTRTIQAQRLVKGNTSKNYAFYDEVDVSKLSDEKQLADSFEKAIENHEFEIWYQPKYYSADRSIAGAEAIVRWRKPDGHLIPPFRFIPLFEQNGMIITLDEYVFRAVCKQQKEWESAGHALFPVSINISRASLYYENIVQRYQEILAEYNIDAKYVPLEVTESATIDNSQVLEIMKLFHDAGFPLYLDDFGAGYSSLATLNLMIFDTLKLDKSLVDFIGNDNGEKLLSYTIQLAKSLGMKITAEGVELEEQVAFLQNLNCDEIQGYFFSKPLPLTDFEKLL